MRGIAAVLLTMSAVALSAAVLGDALTEAAANFIAAHPVDGHQEALVPCAILSAIAMALVCLWAATAGRAGAKALADALESKRLHLLVWLATAALTLAIVVAMEGYETRFGGVAAFDARSVLALYFWPSLVTYACVAALADRLLRACMCLAPAGWDALVRTVGAFARPSFPHVAVLRLRGRDEVSLRAGPGRMHPSWSLRAPPLHGPLSVAHVWRRLWNDFQRARACARLPSFCFLHLCDSLKPPRRQPVP